MIRIRLEKYFLFVFLLFSVFITNAKAGGNIHEIHAIAGIKALDDVDWFPADGHLEIGVEYLYGREGVPVYLIIELLAGSGEEDGDSRTFGFTADSKSKEVNIGVRYGFKKWKNTLPYIEAGVSYVEGELESTSGLLIISENFDESTTGLWFGGGSTWYLKGNLQFGVKAKLTLATVDLPSGREVNLGGAHALVYIGVGF